MFLIEHVYVIKTDVFGVCGAEVYRLTSNGDWFCVKKTMRGSRIWRYSCLKEPFDGRKDSARARSSFAVDALIWFPRPAAAMALWMF